MLKSSYPTQRKERASILKKKNHHDFFNIVFQSLCSPPRTQVKIKTEEIEEAELKIA